MKMNFETLFHVTFVLFVVMDSLGCVPLFLSILKPFEPKVQRRIILREMVIALGVMIFFLFFGQEFFKLINIQQAALQIAGGIILMIIGIRMIFAKHVDDTVKRSLKEPLIVPMAIPAIAGPGILATISLYGGGLEGSKVITLIGILIAWLLSLPILLLSSTLKKILGINGLIAVERLFGYLIVLISAQTAVNGIIATFRPL